MQPSDATPDGDLLPRIAEGDRQAFTMLFRRRSAAIYRFALHMTASPATAEDVTQDVFLVVMREATRYEPERGTVLAWLFGITRNHVRRRLDRARSLEPLPESDEADQPWTIASTEGDPLQHLTREEEIEQVRRAVRSLPVLYREAIVLCDLQEMSYVDAAQALDCAVGTVRSRLHRGRALLGAKLRESQSVQAIRVGGTRCLV